MGPAFELDESLVAAKPSAVEHRWRTGVGNLMKLLFASACILVLISFLMPNVTYCDWERIRQVQCANNLKQIGLALHYYQDRYGVLPPAYIADASGRPMHSWRVLILPFLDHQALYDRYDFREPWDGPNNRDLLGEMPAEFGCPSRNHSPTTVTTYVAIRGPGTMFPGTSSVKFGDVSDGLNNTLMVVESMSVVVPWTAPLDLDIREMSFRINDSRNRAISSLHRGGANVVTGDGRVGFLKDSLPAKKLRSLITIAGQDWNPDDDGSQSY
jgi:hypothetical protein